MAALYDNIETTVMTLEICFIHTFSFVDLHWRQRQVPFALDFADSRRDTALADFVYQFRHAINMTCEGCYAGKFGRREFPALPNPNQSDAVNTAVAAMARVKGTAHPFECDALWDERATRLYALLDIDVPRDLQFAAQAAIGEGAGFRVSEVRKRAAGALLDADLIAHLADVAPCCSLLFASTPLHRRCVSGLLGVPHGP